MPPARPHVAWAVTTLVIDDTAKRSKLSWRIGEDNRVGVWSVENARISEGS